MQKNIVISILGLISFSSAIWSWFSIARSVTVVTASDWIVPGIAVSSVAIALLLIALITSVRWHIITVGTVVFLTVFLFAHVWYITIAVGIAITLYFAAWRAMQKNMRDHVQLRPMIHVRVGASRITMAFAIMISVLFYTTLNENSGASLMFGQVIRSTFMGPVARLVMPAPLAQGSGANGNVTIDDFLKHFLTDKSTTINQDASLQFLENYAVAVTNRIPTLKTTPQQININQQVSQFALNRARSDLGEKLKMTLTGDELVADVFAVSLNDYMQSFAEERVLPIGYTFSAALAGIITLFLFLTLLWVGSLLKFVWMWLVYLLFTLFVRMGMINIAHVQREQEVIA